VKALSLWQPHVAAIALELKPWETRGWSTGYRGPLALHAAKRAWDDIDPWHAEASHRLMQRCSELITEVCPQVDLMHHTRAKKYLHERVLVFGAVVCIADLVSCERTATLRGRIPPEHEFWGDFSDGRYAFKLKNVRLLDHPIPVRGMQGFFDVDLEAALEAPSAAELETAGQLSLFGGG
jgi:activating signal cointegrator 1